MPLIPDVSVIEVDQESIVVEEAASVEVITETVETTSFSLDNEAVEIIEVGIQGPPGAGIAGQALTQIGDFVSESLVYRGEAPAGAAFDAPGWKIARITFTFGTNLNIVTMMPNGSSAYAFKWSDRATLNYLEPA